MQASTVAAAAAAAGARPALPLAARPVVHTVVMQHAEEAAHLRHVRSTLLRAPHVGLLHLGRLDERIAAHLDGLAVAGPAGTALCLQALEHPGAGEVFALAVRALETRDAALLNHVLALVPALPAAGRGVASALGWVAAAELQGVVKRLLSSSAAHERALGLEACRMHQVDPGAALTAALADASPGVRSAALRAAGELGRLDLLPQARQAMADEHPQAVFWAAWAACLLGERKSSLRVLGVAALQTTPQALPALALVLLASPFEAAGEWTRSLSRQALGPARQAAAADADTRRLVRALGLLGDARFVPWLMERMAEPALMRLAGEAFSLITGADLARQDLETLQAPPRPDTPTDDPDDDDVAMDEDDSLPWPDVSKVNAWWARQGGLQAAAASGQRLFAGQPLGMQAASRVLREGTQRARACAALCLSLNTPGRPLFPVAAPTPRQRRWLAGAAPEAG